MDGLTLLDSWRIFNAAGCLVAATAYGVQTWGMRRRLSRRRVLLSFALILALVTLASAAVENVIEENRIGLRVGLTSVTWMWVLLAVRQGAEDDGGAD